MVTKQRSIDWAGDTPGNIRDHDCPTRLVLDRIGDKWTVLVVLVLDDGPLRFTALRESIGGVASKVLTQTLRMMERDGLVRRTVYPEVPPRVVYELTDLGRSLREPIDAVANWAETNFWRINAARQTHDAAG